MPNIHPSTDSTSTTYCGFVEQLVIHHTTCYLFLLSTNKDKTTEYTRHRQKFFSALQHRRLGIYLTTFGRSRDYSSARAEISWPGPPRPDVVSGPARRQKIKNNVLHKWRQSIIKQQQSKTDIVRIVIVL